MELDYLIVGGGIQGLTLLDQLVAAGVKRVLLVTRDPLGVGESLHSHGYMHLGYTLPSANAELGREIADCAARWWERIERREVPVGEERRLTDAQTWWSHAELAAKLGID